MPKINVKLVGIGALGGAAIGLGLRYANLGGINIPVANINLSYDVLIPAALAAGSAIAAGVTNHRWLIGISLGALATCAINYFYPKTEGSIFRASRPRARENKSPTTVTTKGRNLLGGVTIGRSGPDGDDQKPAKMGINGSNHQGQDLNLISSPDYAQYQPWEKPTGIRNDMDRARRTSFAAQTCTPAQVCLS